MKIRLGFVSNSSSSSYIIAFNSYIKLDELFKEGYHSGERTSVNCVGSEEILDRVRSIYCVDYDYHTDSFDGWEGFHSKNVHRFLILAKDVAKAVSEGKDVAWINISFNDRDSYNNLDSDGVEIIREWG